MVNKIKVGDYVLIKNRKLFGKVKSIAHGKHNLKYELVSPFDPSDHAYFAKGSFKLLTQEQAFVYFLQR